MNARNGHTLVEIMVTMTIFFFLLAGALSIFLLHRHSYTITSLAIDTSTEASHALERIVYNHGLRGATNRVATYAGSGWRLAYNGNQFIEYLPNADEIRNQGGAVLCENVADSSMSLTNSGCAVAITVTDSAGGRDGTSTMNSFVEFRN